MKPRLSRGGFGTLLLDPPWNEAGGGKSKRGADRHYPLLKTPEIVPVVLGSGLFVPADNAHLYLWATNNFLPDALEVMKDLGFRYVTCLTWAKPSMGIGQYFRGQTEQLLFGVRGDGLGARRAWTDRRDLSSLLPAARPKDARGRTIHSAKPQEAYALIEAASPQPRLEIFARSRRSGWLSWGNEVLPLERRHIDRIPER